MKKEWKSILKERAEMEGIDFNRLSQDYRGNVTKQKDSVEEDDDDDEDEESANENEKHSQFNESFYDRGHPIIKDLDSD